MILAATFTGMSVDEFSAEAKKWLEAAKDPRWKRPYTELTYQPMQEVLKYLRANGYKTYIVTGGGQDFVRVYSERVYGIPPEQVVGSAGRTSYRYDKDGKPFLTKDPKLLLNDNNAGKPEGIHLMIGRRPYAAFGNSTGDKQMLEYTQAGDGARLAMLRAARRREARVCLRSRARASQHQGRHLHPGAVRRGEKEGLDRHQHEERLEDHLLIRQVTSVEGRDSMRDWDTRWRPAPCLGITVSCDLYPYRGSCISKHVSRIGFQVSDFEIRILDFENKEAESQWHKRTLVNNPISSF